MFDIDASPTPDNTVVQQILASSQPDSRLLIDCLVWKTSFRFRHHDSMYDYGPFHHYTVLLNSVKCLVRVPQSTTFDRYAEEGEERPVFILTGRDKFITRYGCWVVHHFLHVDVAENREATRQGIMHLMVPEFRPEALQGAAVQRCSG